MERIIFRCQMDKDDNVGFMILADSHEHALEIALRELGYSLIVSGDEALLDDDLEFELLAR